MARNHANGKEYVVFDGRHLGLDHALAAAALDQRFGLELLGRRREFHSPDFAVLHRGFHAPLSPAADDFFKSPDYAEFLLDAGPLV